MSILQAGEGEPLVLEMMYVTYIPYVTMILNIPVTLGEKGHVWSLMSSLQRVKGVALDKFLPSLTLNVSILKMEMIKPTFELMSIIKSYYRCE